MVLLHAGNILKLHQRVISTKIRLRMTIHLGSLVVIAVNNTRENVYVSTVTLNGKEVPVSHRFLQHSGTMFLMTLHDATTVAAAEVPSPNKPAQYL